MGNPFSTDKQKEPSRSWALVRHDQAKAREAIQHTKTDFVDPRSLVDNLRPGDMIQVKGNFIVQWFYSHFAVFIGNGAIVHVASSGNSYYGKTVVERALMVDEFKGKLVRKNNHLDNTDGFHIKPLPQIVRTAREQVGEPWDYNLSTNNCEHFATWCRYGRKISLQAFGIGDVVSGEVSWSEYVTYNIKSVKEKVETFKSWVNRKLRGWFSSVRSGFLAIE